MNLLTRLCFGLLAAATNFRVVASTALSGVGSLNWQISSDTAPFIGGSIFERVNGTWALVALPTTAGAPNTAQSAASADGLTLVCTDAATNKNVIIYKRASTSVSFSTASVVAVTLPGVATINGVSISADGTRIAVGKPSDSGGGPSGQHGRIITLVFTSSWQVSSFVGSTNQQLGDNVYLSPNGVRLIARASSTGGAVVYNYSGFPSTPWEETNVISTMTWAHWTSDTACVIAGTDIGYWTRNPSSTELVFRWATSLSSLGFTSISGLVGGSDSVIWVVPNSGGVAILRFGTSAFELAGVLPITLIKGRVSRDLRSLITMTGSGPYTYTLYEQ